jgi:hypothetical protein
MMLGTMQSGTQVMKCQEKVAFGLLVVTNTAEVLRQIEGTHSAQHIWGVPAVDHARFPDNGVSRQRN